MLFFSLLCNFKGGCSGSVKCLLANRTNEAIRANHSANNNTCSQLGAGPEEGGASRSEALN